MSEYPGDPGFKEVRPASGGGGGGGASTWWGKITAFDPTTGIGTARKVTEGTYPFTTAPSVDDADVSVIIGVGAMHYCPSSASRYGQFIQSGNGITPAWTLNQHIRIIYTEPDSGDLHEEQDDSPDGGGSATCT